MFLTWPVVLLIIRDRPADMGLTPDGEPLPAKAAGTDEKPKDFGYLLRHPGQVLTRSVTVRAVSDPSGRGRRE
jgi:hypothetical protein